MLIAATGRRLPLYQALLECGYRDGPRLRAGHVGGDLASDRRAARDRRRRARRSGVLEGIALEVHVLKQRLAEPAAEPDADLPPRVRIAALTRQWLAVAPLSRLSR